MGWSITEEGPLFGYPLRVERAGSGLKSLGWFDRAEKEEKMGEEVLVGRVTHVFSRIGVAVVKLTGTMRVGDAIRIRGKNSDLTQKVESMQIQHKAVLEAKPGEEVGLRVEGKVREGDGVYIVLGP